MNQSELKFTVMMIKGNNFLCSFMIALLKFMKDPKLVLYVLLIRKIKRYQKVLRSTLIRQEGSLKMVVLDLTLYLALQNVLEVVFVNDSLTDC